jgi:anti-sigma factor ChrR (cupin superfamily)
MKLFTLSGVVTIFAVVGLGAAATPLATAQEHSEHVTLTPAELKWANVPSLPPGAKVAVIQGNPAEPGPFTMRIKLPANYKIPAHSHSVSEVVTVLSGTFNGGIGEKLDPSKTKALSAGSVSIMPANMHHFAWTKQATIVQISSTGPFDVNYVNPADDPRKQ